MRRVETGNLDRLAYREPIGCGALIAVPVFFLVMCVLVAATIASIHWRWDQSYQSLLIALAVVFGVALAATLGLANEMFSCVGCTIDRRTRTIEPKWGWFVPLGSGQKSLDRYQELRFCREAVFRKGRRGEVRKFQLYLTNAAGERVRIGRADDYAKIRLMAEDVGAFLGWDVVDAAADPPVRMPCQNLGKPQPPPASLPPEPPQMRTRVLHEGDTTVFMLPRDGGTVGCLGTFVSVAGGLLAALEVYLYFQPGAWFAMGFFGLGGLVLLIPMFLVAFGNWPTVRVAPARLVIELRRPVWQTRTELPADTIREVRKVGSLAIRIFSTRGIFGIPCYHLPPDESDWITAEIRRILAGP